MESYRTLSEFAQAEYVVKKSRFIGYASPVTTEEEALAFIASIKKKHWDATHNVSAYALRAGGIKRFSDDGEPQGTAGLPTLSVLEKEEITDAVLVVTRYFGGILLGGGGLVRAYSHTAKLGADAAGIVTLVPWTRFSLSCDYTYYGKLSTLIPECGGRVEQSDFGEEVQLVFRLESGSEGAFLAALADLTNGRVQPVILGEVLAAR